MNDFCRFIWSAIGGVLLAVIGPTLPLMIICTLMVLADCFTAWQLARRAARAYPDKTGPDGHKFKSHHFGRVIITLMKVYALIIMAFMIQRDIMAEYLPVDLSKMAAGAVCFWQLWSILENESSCNGARWARLLQQILVDKTSRHFDVNLHALSENNPEK